MKNEDINSAGIPGFVYYAGYDRAMALASVGPGWASLINEAFDFLESKGNLVKVVQVKEKYAGLRIYLDDVNDEVEKKIYDLEIKSFHICEKCGNEGKVRVRDGWYFTACDDHSRGGEVVKDFL